MCIKSYIDAKKLYYYTLYRFIIGFGIGLLSMIVPLYQAEIAPPAIRGFAVGLAQQFVGFGVLVSTW